LSSVVSGVEALTGVDDIVKNQRISGFTKDLSLYLIDTVEKYGQTNPSNGSSSTHNTTSMQHSPKGIVTPVESEVMMTNRQGAWVPVRPPPVP